jgi:DNA-binding NarL/FixJ family response regulator
MMKILLVDDEPRSNQALIESLQARGAECITAIDMTEGVIALQKYEISVLVTDIMMSPGRLFPRIDANESGFHLIEYVQEHWPRLPMVCLSVIADQAKIRLLASRGVRYLRKGETPLSTAVAVIVAVAQGRQVRPRA